MSDRMPIYAVSIRELRTWEALCLGMLDNRFYVDQEKCKEQVRITEAAKQLCISGGPGKSPCPIKDDCLEYALANYLIGVFGGTTTDERKKIRAERNQG